MTLKSETPESAMRWSANWLASLPASQRAEFLKSLTPDEQAELFYRWPFWAREEQLPPPGDWSLWLILAGRGFGKTRTGAETTRLRVEQGISGRIALIGQSAADVRDVMVEGESGLLACSPPWFYPKYEPSKRRVTWPNGAVATTFSGDEPDQLRGPQHDWVWADEPAKWRYGQDAWDNMEMGLRLGDNPQAVATTTPRPTKLIKEMVADPQTFVTKGNTFANIGNLAPKFIQKVIRKYEGTRLGRQELHAEILDDNPNALWNRALLERTRCKPGNVPALARIVVGVDPQVADPNDRKRAEASDEDDSAETGIIVAGRTGGSDPHAYILDDKSLRESPNVWAGQVVAAFHQYHADLVVAEINQGGALVEFTVRTVDKNIPYLGVHASRGKYTRAEPISALYEQGKCHHVGLFPLLEDQMCEWMPGDKSPDRMDALVWALTDLMLGEQSWATDEDTLEWLKNWGK